MKDVSDLRSVHINESLQVCVQVLHQHIHHLLPNLTIGRNPLVVRDLLVTLNDGREDPMLPRKIPIRFNHLRQWHIKVHVDNLSGTLIWHIRHKRQRR